MSTPTPMSPPPPLPPHTHCCLSITPPSSLPSTTTNANTPPHPSISATTAEVIEQWHLSCTAFVSETRMQPSDAALRATMPPDAGGVLATPVASKAKYCAPKHSVPAFGKESSEAPASIPCKAMPKKRQLGSNDPSPQDDAQARTPSISPAATAETSVCRKESCPTTASIPSKAMPDGLKGRANKATRPHEHSPASSAEALPARMSSPVDFEDEDKPDKPSTALHHAETYASQKLHMRD